MSNAPAPSEAGPKVMAQAGTLPPPRPGNVVYFANLSRMFFENEELAEELRQRVDSLTSYGGRLLPVISLLWEGTQNVLAIERSPLPLFHDYFGNELGLPLPRLISYEPDGAWGAELLTAVREIPDVRLDGFVTDQRLADLASDCGVRLASTPEGSRRGNNKVLLHRFLREVGEPVFESREAATPSEVAAAARSLADAGYQYAAAKSALGASGIGLIRFPTANPPDIPESHFLEGPCLIEGWLDESVEHISHISSPSVQMLVTDNHVYLYDITDQILGEDNVHEGNVSPPESFNDPSLEEELMRQAGLAGRWLHRQGYRGTASTDFHLAFLHSGEVEVRVCEVNARVTGATYPSVLARHFLPAGTWLMRNLRLPEAIEGERILDNLDRAGLLYRRDARTGILPINLNLNDQELVSKGQFLCLGRHSLEVRDLLDRVLSLENLAFDRD